jgi:molecular chaperone DnaK (HSP70)
MIYTTEKTLKDMADKIGAEEKAKIEEAVADLKRRRIGRRAGDEGQDRGT